MLRCFICPFATKQSLRKNAAIFFVLCLIYLYSRQSWLTDEAIESQLAALKNISLARNLALGSSFGAPGKNKSVVAQKKAANASSKGVHLSPDEKLPLSNSSAQDSGKAKVKRESAVPTPTQSPKKLDTQKKTA